MNDRERFEAERRRQATIKARLECSFLRAFWRWVVGLI